MEAPRNNKNVMKWLSMGTFPGNDVLFCCGLNYKQIITKLKRKRATAYVQCLTGKEEENLIGELSGGKLGGLALYRELYNTKSGQSRKYYFILFRGFNFTDRDYCVLAHEILHIIQFYLPTILDRNREHEAEAYLHTHLMEQALDALRNP